MTTTMKRDQRKQKAGRGQGDGIDYTPYLYIQEVRSYAGSERIQGVTTGRTHHFLSRLEAETFFIYDWSPSVIDIREQFDLDQVLTLRIAERLGIKHPCHPKTKKPVVMTSDFLLTVQPKKGVMPSLYVRTVKPAAKLYGPRTVAKLEIERVYWEARNVDWKIVTNKDIPRTLVWNLEWMYRYVSLGNRPITNEQIKAIRTKFNERFHPDGIVLNRVAIAIDDALGIKRGTCNTVALHLIATRQWIVDLHKRIEPGAVVQIVDVGG